MIMILRKHPFWVFQHEQLQNLHIFLYVKTSFERTRPNFINSRQLRGGVLVKVSVAHSILSMFANIPHYTHEKFTGYVKIFIKIAVKMAH